MRTTLESIGIRILRYGLVLVLLWIGGMKFTAYEAEGIQPLVANSPLLSWTYSVMGVRAFSNLLEVVEITLGLIIALSWHSTMRFPALSFVPGQFLLKDIVLFGAAIYIAGEAFGKLEVTS